MSTRRLLEGSWTPGGLHLAAKAARMLTLGGSGGALGALLAVLGAVLKPLEPSWGVPGRSWAPVERRFGTPEEPIWTIRTVFVALHKTLQNIVFFTVFFGSQGFSEASKIAPTSSLEATWTSSGAQDRSGGSKLRHIRPKLRYIRPPELSATHAKYFRSGQNTV